MAGSPVYPNEVWVALRELWESTPKISVRELRETVSRMTGCECPKEQVIYARRDRDGWKKKPLKKRKNNPVERLMKSDDEFHHPFIPDDMDGTTVSGRDDSAKERVILPPDLVVYPVDATPVLNEARRIMATVEKIVWKQRTRAASAGLIMDSLYASIEQLAEDCPRPTVDDPNIADLLTRRNLLLASIDAEIKMLLNLMMANQIQQKIEREAWGIESSGDDGESDKRKANIALLESKTKSARTGLAQQKSELADRLRMIESGEIFQREEDRGNDDEQD